MMPASEATDAILISMLIAGVSCATTGVWMMAGTGAGLLTLGALCIGISLRAMTGGES